MGDTVAWLLRHPLHWPFGLATLPASCQESLASRLFRSSDVSERIDFRT